MSDFSQALTGLGMNVISAFVEKSCAVPFSEVISQFFITEDRHYRYWLSMMMADRYEHEWLKAGPRGSAAYVECVQQKVSEMVAADVDAFANAVSSSVSDRLQRVLMPCIPALKDALMETLRNLDEPIEGFTYEMLEDSGFENICEGIMRDLISGLHVYARPA